MLRTILLTSRDTVSIAMIVWNYDYSDVLYLQLHCTLSLDITITFNQSAYSVNEDNGPAQPVLVLSNPSSIDITVQVSSINGTAGGEC